MTSHIVGIDLGTTNSCVHIAALGNIELVRFRDDGNSVGEGGASATIPSVVHKNAAGAILVGRAAFQGLGEVPGPIFEVKRDMGTSRVMHLGDKSRTVTPTEVSALILGALKTAAESQQDAPVTHAVVTVPAYFSHRQKADTEVAARQAGFAEVVIQQEPVAAALAYIEGLPARERLILVYDLGGGTFDISIVRQTVNGGLVVVAFGGDKWLGGADFDGALADLLRQRMRDAGIQLTWDLEKNELHRARFRQLKLIAEEAKKQLSESDKVKISHLNVFPDDNEKPVSLETTVTRAEFEKLIRVSVDATVANVSDLLVVAGVKPDDLSAVVMVGGSSRIPLVAATLRARLGKEPQLADPDTIVSRGAALKAAAVFPLRAHGNGVHLDLDYPRLTDGAVITVSGRICGNVERCRATLMRGDYSDEVPVDAGGLFRFGSVPVFCDSVNEFGVAVCDSEENEIVGAAFEVVHSSHQVSADVPDAIIARPVSILTADGLTDIVGSGTVLPWHKDLTLYTVGQSGVIRVPVYESMVKIGELLITDVPRDLPRNTPVRVELHFRSDYKIEGAARVVGTGYEAECVMEIPPLQLPAKGDARKRLLKAEADYGVCIAKGFGEEARPQFVTLVDNLQCELVSTEPRLGRVAEALFELEFLVEKLQARVARQDAMKPPLEAFRRCYERTLKRAYNKSIAVPAFDHERFVMRLTRLLPQCDECWGLCDADGWALVWRDLDQLKHESDYPRPISEYDDEDAAEAATFICDDLMSSWNLANLDVVKLAMPGIRAKIESDPKGALIDAVSLQQALERAGKISLVPAGVQHTETGSNGAPDAPDGADGLLKPQDGSGT